MDYSSKAKSSNLHDCLSLIGTVQLCTHSRAHLLHQTVSNVRRGEPHIARGTGKSANCGELQRTAAKPASAGAAGSTNPRLPEHTSALLVRPVIGLIFIRKAFTTLRVCCDLNPPGRVQYHYVTESGHSMPQSPRRSLGRPAAGIARRCQPEMLTQGGQGGCPAPLASPL